MSAHRFGCNFRPRCQEDFLPIDFWHWYCWLCGLEKKNVKNTQVFSPPRLCTEEVKQEKSPSSSSLSVSPAVLHISTFSVGLLIRLCPSSSLWGWEKWLHQCGEVRVNPPSSVVFCCPCLSPSECSRCSADVTGHCDAGSHVRHWTQWSIDWSINITSPVPAVLSCFVHTDVVF